MGLDMWFYKMKDNKKWDLGSSCWMCEKHNRSPKDNECDVVCPAKCCWWNNANDDIDNYLKKENYYYDRGFENAELEFKLIKVVEKEMNVLLGLDGDPICNPENFNKLCDVFEKWIIEKWNLRTIFDNPDEYPCIGEEQFEFNRVLDFADYIDTARENGFTLWFSW